MVSFFLHSLVLGSLAEETLADKTTTIPHLCYARNGKLHVRYLAKVTSSPSGFSLVRSATRKALSFLTDDFREYGSRGCEQWVFARASHTETCDQNRAAGVFLFFFFCLVIWFKLTRLVFTVVWSVQS